MFQRIIQFAVANRLLLVLALFSISIASFLLFPNLIWMPSPMLPTFR